MKARTWHFDWALALLLAAGGAWQIWVANEQAAAAVREYGYNVDSGALNYAFAVAFLLPVAALFGVAAVVGARGWRLARFVH